MLLTAALPPADLSSPCDWGRDARATAARQGMTLEDADAWERGFGALPLPARAAFVLRRGGTRVLLCPARGGGMRPVLVFACEARDTPPAGVEAPGAHVFVRGGVAVVWSLTALGSVAAALDRARYLAATVTQP